MDEIVKDNKIYRFTNELENTQDAQRQVVIKSILEHLKNYHKLTNIERFHNMLLKCDKVTAKKPFHRLNPFQKKVILKNYLENYLTQNKLNKDKIDKLTEDILDLIKNKKINSKNLIFNPDNQQELADITKIKITSSKVELIVSKKKSNVTV